MALYLGSEKVRINLGKNLYRFGSFSNPASSSDAPVLNTRLPLGYTEVEYIKDANSSTKAYIDLGFTFDTKARVETSMYFENNTNAYLFGAAENSGKLRCMISAPYGERVYAYGSTGSAYNSSGNDSPTYILGEFNDIVAVWENGRLHIANLTTNTSTTVTTQAEYTMTSNLYLFAQNYNGTARQGGVRQIKYFKYYDKNDTLICDLVPCIRNSDDTVGMYDLVTDKFFVSVGTGTFTAGTVVV